MTEWALRSTPRMGGVLREQVRAVTLALRMPALLAAGIAALATVMVTAEILRGGTVIDFHPERWVFAGTAGLLLPIGVWMGEERFGTSFLWTLPVDRRAHALARVGAGWVWLMAFVALLVLWLLALTLLSGGNVLGVETLRFIPPESLPASGAVDAAAARSVRWTPNPVLWLVPFTSATAMYLLASAVTLGVRHPLRWIAGTVLGFFLLSAIFTEIGFAAGNRELAFAPSSLVAAIIYGRYGLDTLLIAGTERIAIETTLPTGEATVVWAGLPDPGPWAIGTLLWIGAGLIALWAAASRHRETRRR
jgi:hypothetical protein